MSSQYNLSTALLGLGEDELRRKGTQRGKVIRRGDSWHILFRQFTQDDGGNVHWSQTSRRVGPAKGPEALSKAEAKEKGFQDHVSKANGLTITPGGAATIKDFYENRYSRDVLPGRARSTQYMQGSLWRRHIEPSLGHCQLQYVNAAMLQTLLAEKQRAGLSTQTIRHIRNLIASIFRHAKRMNYVAGELPTEDLIIHEVRHAERRFLTREQFAILKSQIKDRRMLTLVDVLAFMGLRIGEAAGLRWKCVNLGDKVQYLEDGTAVPPLSILIREQYHRNRFTRLKTHGSRAVLPLTSDTWVPLSEWFERSKFTGPDDTVFAGKHGRPFDAKNEALRRLKPAAVKAGMPWVSWHSLRHTTATWADQVLTPREKMDLLRHKSVQVNLAYTKSDLDRIRQKLETMATNGVVQ